ncbi:MAG TPA: DNA polymerase IV [Anaerolineae bacterium]|nr:DNA polymerase IV [Anaerolineae bacterium]
MKYRKILHLDLDAFFCSVEEKFNPDLQGKPFATGGSPDGRGVVTSCSYAARRSGIKAAMPMRIAIRKCPKLLIVQSHYHTYLAESKKIMTILHNLSPLVEQISIDEAFLDISDLLEAALTIAHRIQSRIYKELGLPSSIGIASNKLVAKIATNIAKVKYRGENAPMAILEVLPGEEAKFLSALPVEEMWGIGLKTVPYLEKLGLITIGDIASANMDILEKHFGKFAKILHQRARGIDIRPVGEDDGIKSISNEITFSRDSNNSKELTNTIKNLSEKVGNRLRKRRLCGFTVRLKVRWPNFETHTRQLTLTQPTNQGSVIYQNALKLFHQIWKAGKPVRLIGICVVNLTPIFQQLSLWDKTYEKESRLLEAIDTLKQRFGRGVIQKGVSTFNYKNDKN